MFNDEVSVTSPVSYKGIFDQSIYDQNDYLRSTPEAQITEEGLVKCLKEKKMARLKEVILKNSAERIKQLQEILAEGTATRYFQAIIRAVPFINALPDSVEKEFAPIAKSDAKRELFKLSLQIRLLEESLEKESIFPYEKKYILMKHKIKSPEIRDQIEKALLLSREEVYFHELVRRFIENCLGLPIAWHRVEPPILQVPKNDYFQNCDPKLLGKLGEIVTKFSFDSTQAEGTTGSRRCIYYFHGDAGAGKSKAARLLPESCEIPYFVFTVKTIEDLSAAALEGSPRTYNAEDPGLLAKALMSKNKSGKTCKNAVLILEDFDRVLFPNADGKDGEIPAALCFLLEYLDPEKTEYFNSYFQAMLDISGLSILITANRPIPKAEQHKAGAVAKFDPYAAIRSRVSEVHFENFSEATLLEICSLPAQGFLSKYGFKTDKATVDQISKDAIRLQKARSSTLEPRDLKRQIERVVIAHKRKVPIQSLCDEAQADSIQHAQAELKPVEQSEVERKLTSVEANTMQATCFQYLDRVRKDRALQYGLMGASVGIFAADLANGGKLLSSMVTGFGMSVGAATGATASYTAYNYYKSLKL